MYMHRYARLLLHTLWGLHSVEYARNPPFVLLCLTDPGSCVWPRPARACRQLPSTCHRSCTTERITHATMRTESTNPRLGGAHVQQCRHCSLVTEHSLCFTGQGGSVPSDQTCVQPVLFIDCGGKRLWLPLAAQLVNFLRAPASRGTLRLHASPIALLAAAVTCIGCKCLPSQSAAPQIGDAA